MEEAFRRAQLYIDALKGCSFLAPVSTIKSYASELDKELQIIREQVQRLKTANKPMNSSNWGKQKQDKWSVRLKPKMSIPPPEVSYDQLEEASTVQGEQAEKK